MGVTVIRDIYGVPHIFAETLEEAMFAQGYVQGEDRIGALLRNYRGALGQMAEVEGEDRLEEDFRKHLLGIPQKARRLAEILPLPVARMLDAFTEGINRFMKDHPDKVPEGAEPVTRHHVLALSLWIVLQWSYRQVFSELEHYRQLVMGGEGSFPLPMTSNAWAVAPSRSAFNTPIRLIDPHVPWSGEYRWHECHLHVARLGPPFVPRARALSCAGFSIVGIPGIALGFNERLSWSATAGGPDTADAFLLHLSPDRKYYRYEGTWREIKEEVVELRVKVGEAVTTERRVIRRSHHGPIVFERGDFAIAVKSAYDDVTEIGTQLLAMAAAQTLDEFIKALSLFTFPPQNIIVATADGDIFYLLNGRTPRRDLKFDFSLPVPGWTKETEWRGLLSWQELPHLLNPNSGFLQNCNNSPEFVTPNSPLKPEKFPDYAYYSHTGNVYRARSERALELLSQTERMDLEDAFRIATDTLSPKAKDWVAALRRAWEGNVQPDPWEKEALQALERWEGRMEKGSIGAGIYLLWRWQYHQRHPELSWSDDDKLPSDEKDRKDAVDAFREAIRHALRHFKTLPTLGEIQRLRRPGKEPLRCDFPLSGTQSFATDCLRAIWVDGPGRDGRFWGVGGQSCTTVVVHRVPPQAWSVTPFGVSDDPESPHFVDQAELFSAEGFKPMWFGWEHLKGHEGRREGLKL